MHRFEFNIQFFANAAAHDTVTTVKADGTAFESVKTYYEKRLVDYAEPELVYDQFGDPYPIPEGGGKTIEFRKYSPLSKALTPITEGVTPAGSKLSVDTVTSGVSQYGDFVELSDMLQTTSLDPVLEQTTKLLASQAARTLDTVTREVLMGGSQRIFAPYYSNNTEIEVDDRSELTQACKFTTDLAFRAAAELKAMNAKPIDDSYVCIVHPYVAYDLMRDDDWVKAHQYAAPENIYRGEIGRLGNLRFVETTEAKIIAPGRICGVLANRMKLKTALDSTGSVSIFPNTTIASADATAINAAITAGGTYKIYVGGKQATVASVTAGAAGTCKFTVGAAVKSVEADAVICGEGAGADGSAVFCCLVLGANAYGVTNLSGGGLQEIIKQRGSSGTADPLDQRSTVGWKATKGIERLVEEYMLRIECGSTYSPTAESN